MSPGFALKWGLKHPLRSIVITFKFSRLEEVPMWQFPYTWFTLTR